MCESENIQFIVSGNFNFHTSNTTYVILVKLRKFIVILASIIWLSKSIVQSRW